MNSIKDHILQLEQELLKSEVRKSADKINDMLSDDFIEFTSSGSEYHYKNGDVFQEQNNPQTLYGEISDFKIKELANDCILAMYKIIKLNELDENKKHSLRSSIWKCFDGQWKMIFHQGTLSSKPEII
ncbi:DUF4440 domain-containing protein [Clostridium beijerinckii]|uniref:DUF4440 domain-containing protein n=1 Tax=Clostridium beijerinckii TaxID=1520 RepID=A0A0B5QH37_CLOBE|nr:DUF4440 domain-containing protein [Clostridium beijerinckii]AJH00241.1 DUF4440 domain-containing protein [Clostridium beijerinckii]